MLKTYYSFDFGKNQIAQTIDNNILKIATTIARNVKIGQLKIII